ncbi:MAG: ATP-binding cassette domain-containing protein [Planctomycetota bacterium]|nr:ATP-binding cassette domain-containing protein [Planctomycetota bacterium]
MGNETLVEFHDVVKRFAPAGAPALDRLSTVVKGGQVTGLVGPDGAGKTTLMRLMAALLLPSEGTLTVCGHDVRGAPQAIHRDAAYMPQRFGLYEDLTVGQNLNLYADLLNVVGEERKKAYDRLLQFTGLGPFTGRLAGKLSGGMKQKLGLACALIRTPRLLLLDEPSVGVDPVSRRELWKMVYELVDEGIGVVWSTAYLDEAERCADVIVLNAGRVMYAGPPRDLTARVEGRTFAVRGANENRRAVLGKALQIDGVIDGVIQGQTVRLVLGEKAAPPIPSQLGANDGVKVVRVPPRFEDAFVSLLGGVSKEQVRSADQTAPQERRQAAPSSTKAAEDVVAADGLTKRFGDFTAADHVTFSIRRGEVFGLLGPNGAGKSTVFKMMCGLLRPSEGTTKVVGLDLARAAAEARGRIGYMAQKFSLYGDLSVRQNLEFFAGVYGLPAGERRATIDHTTDAFGLRPHLDTNSGALPLGFKQRLALACAVMHGPDVLFLDEPTSGVDPLTRREFWARINAMVAQGVTVMVTTHFLDEAEYCDRVGIVYRGRMIAIGTPDELKERVRKPDQPDPTLEDAFIALVEADDAATEQNAPRRKVAS